MRNILYVIAIALLVSWALGFFIYSLGAVIHVLLVLAAISILLRLVKKERI